MTSDPDRFEGAQFPPPDLPAVQPPSTSFFVQLFLLPAVIVFGIMLVWFLFGKIAGGERTPEEYLAILKSSRADRWKAAHDLSRLLREDSAHARDERLAQQLTLELETALAAANPDQQFIEYLAGALGSFQLPTGVPALRAAIRPERDPLVRRAALIALARLAERLPAFEDVGLNADLIELLKDPEADVRGLAALTLGFRSGAAVVAPLRVALGDAAPTVRYNAANALARLGSDAALPVLLEMLDHETLTRHLATQLPPTSPGDAATRLPTGPGQAPVASEEVVLTTMLTGLRSLGKLVAAHPGGDYRQIIPPVEKLTEFDNPMIRVEARQLLNKVGKA